MTNIVTRENIESASSLAIVVLYKKWLNSSLSTSFHRYMMEKWQLPESSFYNVLAERRLTGSVVAAFRKEMLEKLDALPAQQSAVDFDVNAVLRRKKSSTPVPFHSPSSRLLSPNTPAKSKAPKIRTSKPSPKVKKSSSKKRKRALFESTNEDPLQSTNELRSFFRLHSASPRSPKRTKRSTASVLSYASEEEYIDNVHEYSAADSTDTTMPDWNESVDSQDHHSTFAPQHDAELSHQHNPDAAPLLTRAKALHLRIQIQQQEEEDRLLSVPPQEQVEVSLFDTLREKHMERQQNRIVWGDSCSLEELEAHICCTERKSRRKSQPFRSPVY